VIAPTLAIDAGQTQVRAALYPIESEGGPRPGVAPGVRRMDSADVGPDTVAGAVLEAVGALGPLDKAPAAIGLGLSGFEVAAEPDLGRIADVLRERLGPAPVAIATDGATSLLGALAGRPGGVVAAGTGTVAMAYDGARWAKVDGTGSVLGDAGSGFAIGRAGVDAALRHHDGRGGSAALADAAAHRFGPLDQLPLRVSRADPPTRAVAAFAADVGDLAAGGDPAAAAILAEAGRELALSGCAALGRVFDPGARVPLSCTGNVFRAGDTLTAAFAAAVEELRPGTPIETPAGGSLDGAAQLGDHEPVPGVLWRTGA